MLGALFVARYLWPEFSHASPSRLQTESADRYFELSPAPLCAEGVCHGGRVRGWYGDGRARRLPRAKIKIKPFRHVERDRPGGGAAAAGRASRLRRPRHASRASRRRGYPSRAPPDTHRGSHCATVVSCSSRRRPVYSSQRRINYNINDVRRVSDVYCGDARSRARHALARSEPRLSLSLNLSRTLQCGFAFSRSGSGTSRQRPSALPSGLVLA